MNNHTQRGERLTQILRSGDTSPEALIERALIMSPPAFGNDVTGWFLDQVVNAPRFKTYGAALRVRYERAIQEAAKTAGSLEALEPGFHVMPVAMRKMAEAMLKRKAGTPRRTGWKWSKEARQKLSESRKGKTSPPRKRGYPLYSLTPGSPPPPVPAGHRFTVTREDLQTLVGTIFPAGMLE